MNGDIMKLALTLMTILFATSAQAEKLLASQHVEMGTVQAIYDRCSILVEMDPVYIEKDYEVSQSRTPMETELFMYGYDMVSMEFDAVDQKGIGEENISKELIRSCISKSIIYLDKGVFILK